MPRLKPSAEAEKDIQIQSVIRKYMCLRQIMYQKDLAKKIGMPASTFNKKLKRPGDLFSVTELRRTYNFLGVPKEERTGLT